MNKALNVIKENLVPPLLPQFYKGQLGKLAVIGGCRDYTGAPFFSAHSSLMCGVDLVHVICDQQAAGVIKGYSPDLMVHPYLYSDSLKFDSAIDFNERWTLVRELIDKMDVLVIGPGYGRETGAMKQFLVNILKYICQEKTSVGVVLDADALYHLATDDTLLECIKSSKNDNIVLTPNIMEFKRLVNNFGQQQDTDIAKLAKDLKCTIVEKGSKDKICSYNGSLIEVDTPGSLRRVGGQGDTLSGAIGAFLCWSLGAYRKGIYKVKDLNIGQPELVQLSCVGGCYVTRKSANKAFSKKGRSMVASDVHLYLGESVDSI